MMAERIGLEGVFEVEGFEANVNKYVEGVNMAVEATESLHRAMSTTGRSGATATIAGALNVEGVQAEIDRVVQAMNDMSVGSERLFNQIGAIERALETQVARLAIYQKELEGVTEEELEENNALALKAIRVQETADRITNYIAQVQNLKRALTENVQSETAAAAGNRALGTAVEEARARIEAMRAETERNHLALIQYSTSLGTVTPAMEKLIQKAHTLEDRLQAQREQLELQQLRLLELTSAENQNARAIEEKSSQIEQTKTRIASYLGQLNAARSGVISLVQAEQQAIEAQQRTAQQAVNALSAYDRFALSVQRVNERITEWVAGLDNASPSMQRLIERHNTLTNRMLAQARQIVIYRQELANLNNAEKQNEIAIQRKQAQLDNVSRSLEANRRALQSNANAMQELSAAGDKATQGLSRFDVFLANLQARIVSEVVVALGRFVGALGNVVTQGIQSVLFLEKITFSLEALVAREMTYTDVTLSMAEALQLSGQRAQELVRFIDTLSTASTFNRESIAASLELAQAYGFTSDEAERLIQALADFGAGAGANADRINRIALALGQIQAKGRLAGEEVRQLTEAGIPVAQILAREFGITTAELINMQERGLIPAGRAIEALTSSLETDFGGAAARAATETYIGMTNVLRNLVQINLGKLFEDALEAGKPFVQDVIETMQSAEFERTIAEIGEGLGVLVDELVRATEHIDLQALIASIDQLAISGERALPFLINLVNYFDTAARAATQLIVLREASRAAADSFEQQDQGLRALAIRFFAFFNSVQVSTALVGENKEATDAYNTELERMARLWGLLPGLGEKVTEEISKMADGLKLADQLLLDLRATTEGGFVDDRAIDNATELSERYTELGEDIGELNDVYERRNEQVADVTQQMTENEEKYVADTKEANADLKDALADFNTDRAELQSDLLDDLGDLEESHAENVADIGADRLELDRETAESRRELAEETAEAIAELEKEHAEELADIAEERTELDAETQAERAQIVEEATEEIAEIEREHAAELAEIEADRAEARQDLEEGRVEAYAEMIESLAELEREHSEELFDINRDRERAEEDYLLKIEELARRHADKIADIEERISDLTVSHLADQEEANRRHFDKLAELQEDAAEAAQEAADERLEIEEELAADLDALAQEHLENLQDYYEQASEILNDILTQEGLIPEVPPLEFGDIDTEALREVLSQLGVEDALLPTFDALQEAFSGLGSEIQRNLLRRLAALRGDIQPTLQELQELANTDFSELGIGLEEMANLFRQFGLVDILPTDQLQAIFDTLSEEDRERLQELLGNIEAENAAYEEQLTEREAQAQAELEILQAELDAELNAIQDAIKEEEALYQQQTAQRKLEYERRLADLRAALLEENAEYERQTEEINRQHERRLEDLQLALDRELAEYQRQRDEIERGYQDQLADLQRTYNDALAALDDRLTDENQQYDEQTTELQNKNAERLADLQASYDEAVIALDERLTEENTKYAEQQAEIAIRNAEQLADLQATYNEAIVRLDERLAAENERYNEQRADLLARYDEQLTDLTNSYNQRVQTIRDKLSEIETRYLIHRDELNARIDEIERNFQEKLEEMALQWAGPSEGVANYRRELDELRNWLTGNAEYIRQLQEYMFPPWMIPESPSELEKSLQRTIGLYKDLSVASAFNFDTGPGMDTRLPDFPAERTWQRMQASGMGISFNGPLVSANFESINSYADAASVATDILGRLHQPLASQLLQAAQQQRSGGFRSNPGVRT